MKEDDVDALFDLPLAEFTGARNALAKKLAQDGNKAGADEVKKLPKPGVAAWVLNQLARKHPKTLQSYFEASDRLFRAQVRAMHAGQPDPDFRPATDAQRAALKELVDLAGPVAAQGGHKDSRGVSDKVAATLRSAVLEEATRARLREGRMLEDLEQSGFDAFAATLGPLPAPSRSPHPHPTAHASAEDKAEKKDAKQAADAHRARETMRARDAREAKRAAKDALQSAERAASAAAKEHASAAERRNDAARALKELEGEVRDAKKALEKAEAELARGEAKLGLAESATAGATRKEDAANEEVERATAALRELED